MVLICFHVWICGSAYVTNYKKRYLQFSVLYSIRMGVLRTDVTTRSFSVTKFWSHCFQKHPVALTSDYFLMGLYEITYLLKT